MEVTAPAPAAIPLEASLRQHFALRAGAPQDWFEPRMPIERPTPPTPPESEVVRKLVELLADGEPVPAGTSSATVSTARRYLAEVEGADRRLKNWNVMQQQERLAQWPWVYADLILAREPIRMVTTREPGTDPAPPTRTRDVLLHPAAAALADSVHVLPPTIRRGVEPLLVPGGRSPSGDVSIVCESCGWNGPLSAAEVNGTLQGCPKCGVDALRRHSTVEG